ncbi:MAG: hydrogenase maturation protease, partial [Pseudomonadota bacterium]
YLFNEYELVLVLDIVRAGHEPGTVYRLSEQDLRQDEKHCLSLHDIDLLDSLSMAHLSGHKPELHVLGIEPKTIDWDMKLTPVLEERFPAFVELARQEIRKLLGIPIP